MIVIASSFLVFRCCHLSGGPPPGRGGAHEPARDSPAWSVGGERSRTGAVPWSTAVVLPEGAPQRRSLSDRFGGDTHVPHPFPGASDSPPHDIRSPCRPGWELRPASSCCRRVAHAVGARPPGRKTRESDAVIHPADTQPPRQGSRPGAGRPGQRSHERHEQLHGRHGRPGERHPDGADRMHRAGGVRAPPLGEPAREREGPGGGRAPGGGRPIPRPPPATPHLTRLRSHRHRHNDRPPTSTRGDR